MKISTVSVISLLGLTASAQIFAANYNYTTSFRVNGIELNQAVAAQNIPRIVTQKPRKFDKEYSACTTNYEFTTKFADAKELKFEVYSEDNPNIKPSEFFKDKFNYIQLKDVKGHVWLSWNTPAQMTEKIQINNISLSPDYTLNQFRKDFPVSGRNKDTTVLLLNPSEVPKFLKDSSEYTPEMNRHINFEFKGGKLSGLSLQQDRAC